MSLSEKVLAASSGRDRVVDTAKAFALFLVIVGHSLAWTILPDGSLTNTLEVAPNLYPLTWVLQILPIFFFLAGSGMVRYASNPSGVGLFRKIERLVSPTLPLFLIALLVSIALSATIGGPISVAAGLIPIQLTWFIGVYLLMLGLAPLLLRIKHLWGFAALLSLIVVVDVIRATILPMVGWANIVLVWAIFTALGMHLTRLRTVPAKVALLAAAIFAVGAIVIVSFGPYSKALISTTALPGLSNLAPPTVVLALVGFAQISLLLAIWPLLATLLNKTRVWVAVAIFSSRAMGIYLWHMFVLSLLVAGILLAGLQMPPLGLVWWVAHFIVFILLLFAVWFLAPPMMRGASQLGLLLAKIVPPGLVPKSTNRIYLPTLVCFVMGVGFLLTSETGISDPLQYRTALSLPYMPAAFIVMLVLTVAFSSRASAKDEPR